jgi:hypothetical protein
LNTALHRNFPDDLVTHGLKFKTRKEIQTGYTALRQLNVLVASPDEDHSACVAGWMQKLKRACNIETFEGTRYDRYSVVFV